MENQEGMQPPVKVGDRLRLQISMKGKEGDGMGRIGTFIVIVSGTEVGQEYDVEIINVLNRYAFGKVIEDGSS